MHKEPTFTFGIEEEYHLVDLETRDLAPAPPALMDQLSQRLGDRVAPEMLRSQIEIGTPVCRSFKEARVSLARLRREVVNCARAYGMAPIAAGTPPVSRWTELETTPKERYQELAKDLAVVGQRLVISGMHVHVGIEDPELRIDIMNQVRYFLPHLLVLSTSSPFWEGRDTGLKCYRLSVAQEGPRKGFPGTFSSWDEYERTVDVLVQAGVMEDASKIWWDLRPSSRFPTLEMRITDVTPRIDDAITIAALYVCLCRMLYRLRRQNLSWREYPLFLLDENRWRAQRYGVGGSMFDFGKGALVPFKDLLEEILTLVRDDAAALGCAAEVERARVIACEGTSAERQVSLYQAGLAKGASHEAAIRAVVDMLVAETAGKL